MKYIKKIKLKNFKRFGAFSVPLYEDLNVIIGENEIVHPEMIQGEYALRSK